MKGPLHLPHANVVNGLYKRIKESIENIESENIDSENINSENINSESLNISNTVSVVCHHIFNSIK